MARIFISYGDDKYRKSLKRITKQAKDSGLFDYVIPYRQKDLPLPIKSSPLMAFQRGGGYWVWKPYIISHALSLCKEGDIIYYADSGCSINAQSNEWKLFNEILNHSNGIVFQYRDNIKYNGWEYFCSHSENISPSIKHWIKPQTTSYFINYFDSDEFLNFNKIMGGIIIIKKTSKIPKFLSEWLNLSLFHPELIFDAYGSDLTHLPLSFNEHRHDQAIITPLIYFYKNCDNITILPETSESKTKECFFIASRIHDNKRNLFERIIFHTKKLSHKMSFYNH